MGSNNGSVPPNQLPDNAMPLPSHPLSLPLEHIMEERERLALQEFWHKQLLEIQYGDVSVDKLILSPAEVKKIMEAENLEVEITPEASTLMKKASELFIQELAVQSWVRAEAENRSTNPCDLAMVVNKNQVFDFLAHVVDCDHDHEVGHIRTKRALGCGAGIGKIS